MIQRITILIVLMVPLLLSNFAFAHDDQKEDKNFQVSEGRYKVFIAEHSAIVKNKKINLKSIFKIDKDTGTVWRYRQGVDNKGKPYEEFFEVPNQ